MYVGSVMVKLFSILLVLCALPSSSFAEYDGNTRTIPLQFFKDRFTTGELISISTAYVGDEYIRTVVMKLSEMGSVELDSNLVKNSIVYLTSKAILSTDRARVILK